MVAAVVRRGGEILISRRHAHAERGGQWEFPGGKLEPGESPEECLRRELIEEMGAAVAVKRPLPLFTHHYDTFTVTLYPFTCSLLSPEITLHEHSDVVWLPPGDLHTLDWLEADRPLLEMYLYLNSTPDLTGDYP